jgi:hypothetical protein
MKLPSKGTPMRFISATLFLSALGGVAAAQQAGAVSGAGTSSCAEFAKLYRQNPEATESYFFFWAQGFLSGLNLGLLAAKRPLHDLAAWSFNDQKARIRQFCDQRPLLTYNHAVLDLFTALPEIPGSVK